MRLPDQIRAVACVSWVGVLGLGIYVSTLAEALAHQPESTRALDMPRMSGGARAVPPSGGDLRLHTEGKAHQKRAGLTGENRSPLRSASESREVRKAIPGRTTSHNSHFVGGGASDPDLVARSQGDCRTGTKPAPRLNAGSVKQCGVTLGRDRGFASESSEGVVESCPSLPACGLLEPVARSQGVRSVLPGLMSQPVSFAERAPGGHLRQMASVAANLCGVPPALLHALIARESSWRQYDSMGRVLRSKSGALGLTQIKASTAREVGLSDPHEPWGNLLLGACYLRRMHDRFGTWERALHAYRLGPNARVSIVARQYASDIITGSAQ